MDDERRGVEESAARSAPETLLPRAAEWLRRTGAMGQWMPKCGRIKRATPNGTVYAERAGFLAIDPFPTRNARIRGAPTVLWGTSTSRFRVPRLS